MVFRVGVIGSSGAIGKAIAEKISRKYPELDLHSFSSSSFGALDFSTHHIIDYKDEASIQNAALKSSAEYPFDLVIVATGVLHDEASGLDPEKSLRDLSAHKFETLFAANTIFPSLVMKHFLPFMNNERRSVFAALSARVGSVSDNQIGGWYAYRASKAALNMVIKNAAIEIGRRNKKLIVLGLHPGTVDSGLSKPFQRGVQHEIFSADQAAQYLLNVISNSSIQDSGKCLAWDGQEIYP